MNKNNFADTFQDQLIAISKAGAYDAMQPEYERLQKENARLKSTIAELEIKLKFEKEMVVALKDLINEVRPSDATTFQLSETDKEIEDELNQKNEDDLRDVL